MNWDVDSIRRSNDLDLVLKHVVVSRVKAKSSLSPSSDWEVTHD